MLYHGLGTGKTCSAIGVSEEMRDYLKRIGTKPKTQKIIIVASPNVQKNFRLQLFDERKLEKKNGIWNIQNCVGNKFLKEINQEINPEYIKDIPKKIIIRQIENIINNSYLFIGYGQLANWIAKLSDTSKIDNKKHKSVIVRNKLQKVFNERLIIIDEIHNIRLADTKTKKVFTDELEKLVRNADNMRLLLLSATPMFNSYTEIIWLINLMNINDKRSIMNIKSVFNKDGNFITKDDKEIGKELFERKITGYVSFVRGENPYIFPYRIWPSQFNNTNSIFNDSYPEFQLNGKAILQPLEYIDVFTTHPGSYQQNIYDYIINKTKADKKNENKSHSNCV